MPLPIQKDWPDASTGWRWIGLAERAAIMENGAAASASGRREATKIVDGNFMINNSIEVDE